MKNLLMNDRTGMVSSATKLALVAFPLALAGCSGHISPLPAQTTSSSSSRLATELTFHQDDSPPLSYSAPTSVQPTSTDNGEGEITLAPSTSGGGSLVLSVTDAPVNGLDAVYLTFSKIQIQNRESGAVVTLLSQPTEFNLLDLQDGLAKLVGSADIPAGIYNQIRFYISAAAIETQGALVHVAIPEKLSESGLRIYGLFEVKNGSATQLTLDFDLSRLLVWTSAGPLLRPVASLRSAHFQPAGIHLEEAADGSMSLVGPPRSVRARAWLQMTDSRGEVSVQRAEADGSFVFDQIPKVYGNVEFAVLARRGDPQFDEHLHCKDAAHHHELDTDASAIHDHRGHRDWERQGHGASGEHVHWLKIAWMEFPLDFAPDARFPAILASSLDQLFLQSFTQAGSDPATFLGLYKTDAFRFLAGLYVQAKGYALPSGFVMPQISAPYPFALEGPDYLLPGYTFAADSRNYYSGGPDSAGCSDGAQVFGNGAVADAMDSMVKAGLPFTGLLAEYHAVCLNQDLAALSCATLGSLERPSSHSLPAEQLIGLDRVLNSPRGGLITKLMACVRESTAPALQAVSMPAFPADGGCWFGCPSGPQENYLTETDLMLRGAASDVIGDASQVIDLDTLVEIADQASVSPLTLMASYIADQSASKVHGYVDRSAPALSNLLPQESTVTDQALIDVSGLSSDRTTSRVTVNGQDAPVSLGTDGFAHFGPISVDLIDGTNAIAIDAEDESGNHSQAVIHVTANLPEPEPSPSPSPSTEPSPEPTPSPTPTPTPTAVSGVSDLCQQGEFVPQGRMKMGVSIDPSDGAFNTVVGGLQTLGFSPTIYSDDDIANGKPIFDGTTLLVITREVSFHPATQAYLDGVRNFIAAGGSVVGEYDGAALFFSAFAGSNHLILDMNPSLALFDGNISGGGALLPLVNSTIYITDASDPIMAGMPSSYLVGARTAFTVTDYNDGWLHTSATFTSAGTSGLVPVGTYPAVLSGHCGPGRVVLFMTNQLQVATLSPVNRLVTNAMNWAVGLQ